MQVNDLEPGQRAAADTDRIIISVTPNRTYQLDVVFYTGGSTAHFVALGNFPTSVEARKAGIEWAGGSNIAQIYVEYAV